MTSRSLRREVQSKIDRAIAFKDENSKRRHFWLVVGIIVGIFPFGFLFVPIPTLGLEVKNGDPHSWLLSLWGIEATFFALTVAVVALVISVGIPTRDRKVVLDRYRKRGFDFSLAVGIVTFFTTGLLWLLFAILKNSSFLNRGIIGVGLSFLVFIIGMSVVLTITIRTITNGGFEITDRQRLRQNLITYVRTLAISALSSETLRTLAKSHGVEYVELSLAQLPGHHIEATIAGTLTDVNLKQLDKNLKYVQARYAKKVRFMTFSLDTTLREQASLFLTEDKMSSRVAELLRRPLKISTSKNATVSSAGELSHSLVLLRDKAIEACQSNVRKEFQEFMDDTYEFYQEVIEMSSKIKEQCNVDILTESTFLLGWLTKWV